MSRIILKAKVVGTSENRTFDFTSQLATGETISTQSVACSVFTGVDASPSSMISGAASHSGAIVTQLIIGGVAGVIYELVCTVTTSLGQTLKLTGYLAAINPLP
jgi:hypothetical protein